MIFVTVGTQGPFDRLVRAVDEWAGRSGRRDVFCQIGSGGYRPRHVEAVDDLPPDEFAARFEEADVVVAHAGMGTIISALERGKPLLVMPRRARFHEMRNDHQVATAEHFGRRGAVHAAMDEEELSRMLDRLDELGASKRIGASASPELLRAIREFV